MMDEKGDASPCFPMFRANLWAFNGIATKSFSEE
jgi:hypothetical protein